MGYIAKNTVAKTIRAHAAAINRFAGNHCGQAVGRKTLQGTAIVTNCSTYSA